MSTNTKKPAKKKAAKPNGLAPIPPSRLKSLNAQKKKAGKPLIDATGAVVEVPPVEKILACKTPIDQIMHEKVELKDGGVMKIHGELSAGEGVSLISFFSDTGKHSALYIGTIVAHLTKKDRVNLDAIAEATGLEIKTLQNMAATVRGVGQPLIAKVQKLALENNHEVGITHMGRVAGLPAAQQERILTKAASEGLSVTEVANEAKKVAPASKKRESAAAKKKEKADAAEAKRLETARNAPETPVNSSELQQGLIVLDTPLSPDDEARNDRFYKEADELGDYLKSENFKLLKVAQKKDWLDVLSCIVKSTDALIAELTELAHASQTND